MQETSLNHSITGIYLWRTLMNVAELAFTNSRNFLVDVWFGVRLAAKFIRCSSIHSNKNIGREKMTLNWKNIICWLFNCEIRSEIAGISQFKQLISTYNLFRFNKLFFVLHCSFRSGDNNFSWLLPRLTVNLLIKNRDHNINFSKNRQKEKKYAPACYGFTHGNS